jgi:hypothetical protein
MGKDGKLKTEKWSKEEIAEYLIRQYPKGLRKSEQETDREARENRREEAEKVVNKLLELIEEVEEGEEE